MRRWKKVKFFLPNRSRHISWILERLHIINGMIVLSVLCLLDTKIWVFVLIPKAIKLEIRTIECIGISYANCHYVQDPIIYSIFRINPQKLCICHTYINDELAIIFIFAASLFSFQLYNIWRWYIISCHVLTGR